MKRIVVLVLLMLVVSCSKDDANNEEPQIENEVADNVVLILDETSNLVSSESDILNGIYIIEFSDNVPEILPNDIIVGDQDNGFLRKVANVVSNENTLTINTTQATIDELFNSAVIEFSTDISESARMGNISSQSLKVNYLANGMRLSDDGFEYNFSDTVLYQEDGLTFTITNGVAIFNPSFSFESDYSLLGGFDYLDFKAENANLTIDCDISLNATDGVALPGFNTTLADVDKRIAILVAGIPVIIVFNTTLVAEFSGNIEASVDLTTGFTNSYTLNAGVNFDNESWSGNFDFNSNLVSRPINIDGVVNITQNLTITPKVSVKFYNVIGPYCQPQMTEDFNLNASTSLDWDSKLDVGFNFTLGVETDIFSVVNLDYSKTNNFSETIWSAPINLEIVSGNDQTGSLDEALDELLIVKVTDNLGNALPNVNVYFEPTTDDFGTISPSSGLTDSNGNFSASWTLGESTQSQSVEASIKAANESMIASVSFNATPDICSTSTLAVTTSSTEDSATATPIGGQSPYTYLWSNGSTNATATNLTEGTYTVVVTDALGCTATGEIDVIGNSDDPLVGTWIMESFIDDAGDQIGESISVGTYVNLFFVPECPSLVTRLYTIESQVYNIYSSTYSYTEIYKERHTNIGWDGCTVVNDDADTYSTYNEDGSGSYIFSDGIYSATPTGSTETLQYSVTFINDNKISIEGNIYNRQ